MQALPLHSPDLGSFFGRGHEIATLVESIRSGVRILTIAGPSGMGKSRLAAQAADALLDDADAELQIVTCKLEGCARARDLPAAILEAMGEGHSHAKALSRAIGDQKLLLILDDLEPTLLAVAAALVDKLVDDCGGLQVLLTSLAPMGIDGEVQFELGPLEPKEAVELYLEHAHRFRAGRIVHREDGPAIEELVRRLDRIPLAIELAAARVRVLPPRALLARLSERFEILQTGGAGRHDSLYRAVERTWDLLHSEEKLFAARASVFQGGFSLDAAEAVLGGQEGVTSTLAQIAQLRAKALIQVDESQAPRYVPYESVRDFAALRLRRMEHEAETIRLHAAYFLREGERRMEELSGPGAAEAIDWIATEHGNLIAAHRRCLVDRPSMAARLGLIVGAVIGVRPLPISETSLADAVLDAARRSGDATLEIQALRLRSRVLLAHGRFEEGQVDLDFGLELARQNGELLLEGFLICERMQFQPDFEPEAPLPHDLDRVRLLAEDQRSTELAATAIAVAGEREEAKGELVRARELFEDALRIAQHNGHLQVASRAQIGLGEVYGGLALYREARHALQEASSILRALGDVKAQAETMVRLGRMELGAGRLEEAEEQTTRALALMEQWSGHASEARAMGILGQIALAQGKHELAEKCLAAAVAGLIEASDRRGHATMLAFLAAAAAMQGRHLEGSRSLNDAKAYFEESGDRFSLLWIGVVEATLEVMRSQQLLPGAGKGDEEAVIARARRTAAAARDETPHAGSNILLATQLLEQALAKLERKEAPQGLVIGPGASWFTYGGAARVSLHRRRSLRRLLMGLVKQRLEHPGVGLGSLELFRLGWIGEDIGIESATARVYTGIWTLRSLGLGEALVNKGDGYMLRPELELELVE